MLTKRFAAVVVADLFPEQPQLYQQEGWSMHPSLDRVRLVSR